MGNRIPPPSKGELKRVLEAEAGIISGVCRQLGVSRVTVGNWIDRYDLRGYLEEFRKTVDDECRMSLRAMILERDRWAIKTWMTMRGMIKTNAELNSLAPDNHGDVVSAVNQAIREANGRDNSND